MKKSGKIILPILITGVLAFTACGSAGAAAGSQTSGSTTASGSMAVSNGSTASGGMTASAGSSASGGMTASAGNTASGGMTASAGSTASGGMMISGSSTAASASTGKPGFGLLNSFSVKSLDGAQVDQTIFSGAKLTMVNVWATFCGPCINEMPELGTLAAEYKDKGFQIVGIPIDTLDSSGKISDSQIETAKSIVEKTGAAYTHLEPTGALAGIANQVMYVPTTIFVDKDGNQVGDEVTGAMSKEEWTALIDKYLAEV